MGMCSNCPSVGRLPGQWAPREAGAWQIAGTWGMFAYGRRQLILQTWTVARLVQPKGSRMSTGQEEQKAAPAVESGSRTGKPESSLIFIWAFQEIAV